MNTKIKTWHLKSPAETLKIFQTRESGLTTDEVKARLAEHGPNKLPEGKTDTLPIIFLRQFQSPLIYTLLGATFLVLALGEYLDAIVIAIVLVFNAIIGTFQEGRAQNTLLALKRYSATVATVRRGGKEFEIDGAEVVPGDIIVLEEGQKVPTDARLISANNLKVDEASLTGESEPVSKTDATLTTEALALSDRKNMVFKSTNILTGSGLAMVVATGLKTEVGKIAKEIAIIDTEIPLKRKIRNLSRVIVAGALTLSGGLIVVGLAVGNSLTEMVSMAVALSVSAIPEGLPVVLTLVLATGVWRMSKRNTLVKRLQAVEALGQAKIVALDKTGTLTQNRLVLQEIYSAGQLFKIGGTGYEPKGAVNLNDEEINPLNYPALLWNARLAGYCAKARLFFSEAEREWRIAGEPTEAAMLVLSEKLGFSREVLKKDCPFISEIPFNHENKYHATIHQFEGQNFLTVVGAPEKVLALCQNIWTPDGEEPLTEGKRALLMEELKAMASRGYRVLIAGFNPASTETVTSEAMPALTFAGLWGMKDALRPEATEAVAKVKAAGMRVVMITGDHALTAQAIAVEVGIWQTGDQILTGVELEQLSPKELANKLPAVSVFARVSPAHKLRIIQAYRLRGEVVAMTGDGVNDAPSLVAADLGLAMGKIGTEVAKEAADIVLLDDNFANIVEAAEEGRNIYQTIKKVTLYLFASSFGEVLTIVVAILIGWPLPILPAQIIWLNFVTDGFLDVALAMEPKEEGLLRRRWRRSNNWLIDGQMVLRIVLMALPMAVITLLLFKGYFEDDLTKAWTISLTTLAVFQWFNAWNCRSGDRSLFSRSFLSNKFLIGATAIVVLLQLAIVYHPFLQTVMRTSPLLLSEWALIGALALSVVLIEEIRKMVYRWYWREFKLLSV
jgi:Ca2+-transporting ATPase